MSFSKRIIHELFTIHGHYSMKFNLGSGTVKYIIETPPRSDITLKCISICVVNILVTSDTIN